MTRPQVTLTFYPKEHTTQGANHTNRKYQLYQPSGVVQRKDPRHQSQASMALPDNYTPGQLMEIELQKQ